MKKMFANAMNEYKGKTVEVVDPFARRCPWGTIRNDINPEFKDQGFTTHCDDALAILQQLNTSSVAVIILDPPFSGRQSDEEYGTHNLYANPSYMSQLGKECYRVLIDGGKVLKCGFNSNPPARGFELIELFINNMGASRNDIMMSLWVKTQMNLHQWIIPQNLD